MKLLSTCDQYAVFNRYSKHYKHSGLYSQTLLDSKLDLKGSLRMVLQCDFFNTKCLEGPLRASFESRNVLEYGPQCWYVPELEVYRCINSFSIFVLAVFFFFNHCSLHWKHTAKEAAKLIGTWVVLAATVLPSFANFLFFLFLSSPSFWCFFAYVYLCFCFLSSFLSLIIYYFSLR